MTGNHLPSSLYMSGISRAEPLSLWWVHRVITKNIFLKIDLPLRTQCFLNYRSYGRGSLGGWSFHKGSTVQPKIALGGSEMPSKECENGLSGKDIATDCVYEGDTCPVILPMTSASADTKGLRVVSSGSSLTSRGHPSCSLSTSG